MSSIPRITEEQPPTASHVFYVPELLEQILIGTADALTILRLQRTNRIFRDLIESSPSLKRILFTPAVSDTVVVLKPKPNVFFTVTHPYVHPLLSGPPVSNNMGYALAFNPLLFASSRCPTFCDPKGQDQLQNTNHIQLRIKLESFSTTNQPISFAYCGRMLATKPPISRLRLTNDRDADPATLLGYAENPYGVTFQDILDVLQHGVYRDRVKSAHVVHVSCRKYGNEENGFYQDGFFVTAGEKTKADEFAKSSCSMICSNHLNLSGPFLTCWQIVVRRSVPLKANVRSNIWAVRKTLMSSSNEVISRLLTLRGVGRMIVWLGIFFRIFAAAALSKCCSLRINSDFPVPLP